MPTPKINLTDVSDPNNNIPTREASGALKLATQHLVPAAGSIAITHPLRVMMNRSYLHPTLFGVLRDMYQHGGKGFFLNLTRGTTILTAQSLGKDAAQFIFGDTQSSGAKVVGLFGAATAGSLTATIVETPFNRVTNESYPYQVQRFSIIKKCTTAAKPLFRFNAVTFAAYFARDSGFSYLVRIAKDLPPYIVIPSAPAAVFLTVSAQNIALRINSNDLLLRQDGSFPHWSIRKFFPILHDIAKGKFTHPDYVVPIRKPQVSADLLKNLLSICCGKNMFFWRSAYIGSVFGTLAIIQHFISEKPTTKKLEPLLNPHGMLSQNAKLSFHEDIVTREKRNDFAIKK